MEFVGKIVKKDFKGFGLFEGVVESYDSSTGLFKILYEDGDSEEADFSEVVRLSSFAGSSIENDNVMEMKRLGRKPKRRRRNGCDIGKPSDSLVDCHSGQKLGFVQNVVDDDSVNGNLDLNRGLNFDDLGDNVEIRGCIDLNLSVNNEFDGVDNEKKERCFDLNLGFNDESANWVNSLDGVRTMGMPVCALDASHVNDSKICEVRLGEGVSDEGEVAPSAGDDDGSASRRKKRKVARDLNSPTEIVLRRSARRSNSIAVNESNTVRATPVDAANDLSISGVTDESEENRNGWNFEILIEPGVLPPKIAMPPSSTNLNLEGIPILDLFSVYSCLRSFSNLLYLSPFKLQDFVAALKSRVSNLLIDFIHVALLRTLRKHLEFLANEGCESASTCLRNLNWELLDVITWPVFMVEYLLIHGSQLKPGFSLDCLKLFDGEYYKQPAEVKIELLHCLCDDVIEVEAIRSELSRRMNVADAPVDSGFSEGVMEEVNDGNSDECCLCKMDGNLICCDGCPAAYHSKCVGIVSILLPEGDWYCPECVISRLDSGSISKSKKLIRGAELLGIDPYGRLYFSCLDYLLVSDAYGAESSFNYYHKDDLDAVIQLLRSSDILYGSILRAIFERWAHLCQPKSDLVSQNGTLKDGSFDGRKTKTSFFPGYSSSLSSVVLENVDLSVKHSLETENPLTSSEGSAEVVQANQLILSSSRPGAHVAGQGASTKSISAAKKQKKNRSSAGRHRSSVSKDDQVDVLQGQSGDGHGYMNCYSFAQTAASVVEELLQKPSEKVNVGIPKTEEEIISIQSKFILKKSTKFCWTTIQDPNVERQREKCGWCYCCRFPVEGRGCLFNIQNSGSVPGGLKAELDGFLLKRNKKGHLVHVICHVLCMEVRLRGLLSGPWLSPHHSKLWCKSVLKASDISSLKRPLLMLEFNLHPLALCTDWWKNVDCVTTMGSASHFVANPRVSSKIGISRKKGRYADSETNRKKGRYADSETKSLIARGGLGLFWWRGGKVSRSLFNWKVIPRSLALKAARKGGCIKIPGVHYPDSSENPRRSKYVAWRASVETSTSLEQLALQVRELDLSIRWDDIENTHPHSILDKESIKSIRLFKKVIIRRKCVEGAAVKYLLDFGKRRSIPDVVLKHGLKLEDSSGERKKYWLEESYVPLHLLKSFEQRRITRKVSKTNSSKAQKGGRAMKKPFREKGFDYLFARAERADSYQCGHCNKNVPISEAVNCQRCKGFFHKRHVRKSSDAITAGCTYTCHRCRAGKHVMNGSSLGKRKLGKLRDLKNLKVDIGGHTATLRAKPRKNGKALAKRGQLLSGQDKKMQFHEQSLPRKSTNVYAGITLRRSARRAKYISLPSNTSAGGKKRKRNKSRNMAPKETPKSFSWHKRRTRNLHSLWINGLMLSRKPNDERVLQFKRRRLLIPSEFSDGFDRQPKCSLCSEQEFTAAAMYIACEICGDWFHGDAFGLDKENTEKLIGFKCHGCRERSPPVCPFVDISTDKKALFTEATSEVGTQCAQVFPEIVVPRKGGTDCVQEFSSYEGPKVVEMLSNSDGDLDHDETPTMDSELRMENGLPAGKEVVDNVIEGENGHLKAGLPAESDENNMLEGNKDQLNESQLTPDDETASQTPTIDSELRVENGLPACKEVVENVIEGENGHLKADLPAESDEKSMLEGNKDQLNESQLTPPDETESQTPMMDSKLILENDLPANKEVVDNVIELPTEADEMSMLEGNKDQLSESQLTSPDETEPQTPMMDSELRVENGLPASKDIVDNVIDGEIGHLKADLPTEPDEKSMLEGRNHQLNESQLSPSDKTEPQTPMMDSQLRVENGLPTIKDIVNSVIDGENGHLNADLPTEPDEKSMLEGRKGHLNDSQLTPLDKTESQTPMMDSELRVVNWLPASKDIVDNAIDCENGHLKSDLAAESDEKSMLERRQDQLQLTPFDETGCPPWKSVLEEVDAKDSEDVQ